MLNGGEVTPAASMSDGALANPYLVLHGDELKLRLPLAHTCIADRFNC